MTNRTWSEAELDVLRTHGADMSSKELADLLPGRSPGAVTAKACDLGIRRSPSARSRICKANRSDAWTEAEDDIIRTYGPHATNRELAEMLPGRAIYSIQARASKLGVSKSADAVTRAHRAGGRMRSDAWSDEELEILRECGPRMTNRELMEALPGRTIGSIGTKARKLGVPRPPDALERSLDARCRRQHGHGMHERMRRKDGYMLVYRPGHPRADRRGYVLEHIVVWEETHGMLLPDGWVVHHKDEVRDHNDPANLEAMPIADHVMIHHGLSVTVEDVAGLLNAGMSRSEICKVLGMGTTAYYARARKAREAGLLPDGRKGVGYRGGLEEPDVAIMLEMRLAGASVAEIAEATGLGICTVRKRIEEAREAGDPRAVLASGPARKGAYSFSAHGIPVGAELVLAHRPDIKAVVVGDRSVTRDGLADSLLGMARRFLGDVRAVNGARLWSYNGVKLDRIPKIADPGEGGTGGGA